MNEHRIHLRRVWTGEFADGNRRVDLPIAWEAGEIPTRLRRGFQRPRLDASAEIVFLEMQHLAGVVAVQLNGQNLPIPADDLAVWEVAGDDLRDASNELILELDPAGVPTGEEWGQVALVIRQV